MYLLKFWKHSYLYSTLLLTYTVARKQMTGDQIYYENHIVPRPWSVKFPDISIMFEEKPQTDNLSDRVSNPGLLGERQWRYRYSTAAAFFDTPIVQCTQWLRMEHSYFPAPRFGICVSGPRSENRDKLKTWGTGFHENLVLPYHRCHSIAFTIKYDPPYLLTTGVVMMH